MIPGMNFSQRVINDASGGKSSDFLKNQFLDPKKEIMENFKSGNVLKPINLVPNWVRKVPVLSDIAKISDTITKHTIDPVLKNMEVIKNKNDIYIKNLMHNQFDFRNEFNYHTYPNMSKNSPIRSPFDLRLRNQGQMIRDEENMQPNYKSTVLPDIRKDETFLPLPQVQPPFPSKFYPIDQSAQSEFMKPNPNLTNEINYNELIIPVSIG